jgi:hypothetical protein
MVGIEIDAEFEPVFLFFVFLQLVRCHVEVVELSHQIGLVDVWQKLPIRDDIVVQ